jgi:phosphate transport system ATP-binding protein
MNIMPQTIVTPDKPRIMAERPVKIVARDVNVYYGDKQAIKNLSIGIPDRAVSSFIGPSGCGKTTFLRAINRMNDTIPTCRMTGEIAIDGKNVYDKDLDVVQLRARVGMVFQKPIRSQVDLRECRYGLAHPRVGPRQERFEDIVVNSLKRAAC